MRALLEYTLALDSKAFDTAIKGANTETKNFTATVNGLTPSVQNAARNLTVSFTEMREATRGSREGIEALKGSMQMIGFTVAPQMTTGIMAAVDAIKAMMAVSELGAAALGTLGLAAAGLGAAIGICVTGFQALQAQVGEIKSDDALHENFEFLRGKYIPMI
jgi:hypothetical protein